MAYTFVSVYKRSLGLLRPVRGLVATLAGANLLLAAIPFVDPILFGRAKSAFLAKTHGVQPLPLPFGLQFVGRRLRED
jgi:hypothetical protein